MGDYHYWHFRRVIRVAIAIAFASVAYCQASASAAESTVKAAKTGTSGGVSEALLSANTNSTLLGAEPLGLNSGDSQELAETLSIDQTTAAPSDGVAANLSAIEAAAGMVDADFGMEEQKANISFGDSSAQDNEIYEIILGVMRGRDTLSNTVTGAERNFTYYVPLNELARILKLPSSYDPQAQRITGYALHPENTFAVDLQNNNYTRKGETAALPPGSAFYRENFENVGDIYVSFDIANALWGLDLELDLRSLSITVNTPKKLPYELERARQKSQKMLARKDTGIPPDLDLIETPSGYRWLGPHVFSISNQLGYSERSRLTNSTNITGTGDLLGASANYTIGLSSNEQDRFDVRNARILLTREGYGDDKTLPFGLKKLKVGDLVLDTNRVVSNVIQGRGIYINTDDEKRYNSYGEITINGVAEPGWEVELYRHTQLLDYGYVGDDGQYIFEDVLLQVGDNDFKIVLYGPQGQIEERIESYPVNAKRLRPGETHVEASVIDYNRPVFDVQDRQQDPTMSGNASFIRLSRGINHNLSSFASLQTLPTREGDRAYAAAGVEYTALGGVGQSQVIRDIDNSGTAFDTTFRRKFSDINTTAKATIYKDFESPIAGFGKNAKTLEGSFRAFKNFSLSFAELSLSGGADYEKRKDGDNKSSIDIGQSARFEKTLISHNIGTNYTNNDRRNTQGTIAVKHDLADNWSTRGALKYNLYPDSEVDNFQYSLNYRGDNKLNGQLNILKDLNGDNNTRVSLNSSYDFGTFLGGATLSWDDENGYSALLNASTTFGPESEGGKYIATTAYDGYKTRLQAHLYEDLDKSGTFTDGDRPVQGVRLKINRRKTLPSDEDGMVNLDNAGPPGEAAITLERDTMPNPFLVPEKDGYTAVLRPGTKPFINFPLYPSGSIDGTVRNANGSAMAGMVVQLLDENGTFLQEAPTLFDGFYVFEFVRPGTYTVQVSPSHQVNVPPKTVTVTSEDLFAYGVDLILLEQASEVSVTDDSVVRDGGRVAQRNHAPVADGTLLPAPSSSDGQFDAVVRAVRIGEHPYMVRLVLDLSEPTTYSITAEDDKRIINIDLPGTAWDATREWKLDKHPMFQSCDVFSIDNGSGTRLRLTSRRPINIFYNATIPAENGLPDRVYVDFLRK